jgi:hypothetical protein
MVIKRVCLKNPLTIYQSEACKEENMVEWLFCRTLLYRSLAWEVYPARPKSNWSCPRLNYPTWWFREYLWTFTTLIRPLDLDFNTSKPETHQLTNWPWGEVPKIGARVCKWPRKRIEPVPGTSVILIGLSIRRISEETYVIDSELQVRFKVKIWVYDA